MVATAVKPAGPGTSGGIGGGGGWRGGQGGSGGCTGGLGEAAHSDNAWSHVTSRHVTGHEQTSRLIRSGPVSGSEP
eukprot:4468968-Prymnesium_polylepis.2